VEERMAMSEFISSTKAISTSHMRLKDRQKLKDKCKVLCSPLHLEAFWLFMKRLAGMDGRVFLFSMMNKE
jgi:hypothetical protein